MELTIEDKLMSSRHEYEIYENKQLIYTAQMNKAGMFYSRKIILYELNGEKVCDLSQSDKNISFLRFLPIINWYIIDAAYIYNINEKSIGSLKMHSKGGGHIKGILYGKEYQIWPHKTNQIYVYENNIQVSLIERCLDKITDKFYFNIIYSGKISRELITMLCLISDGIWFAGNEETSYTYSEAINFTKREFNENWKPED